MALTITKAEQRMVPDSATGKYEVKYLYEMLVDAESDCADAPGDALPGSMAYTADGQNWWMKANDGTWTEFGTVETQEEET